MTNLKRLPRLSSLVWALAAGSPALAVQLDGGGFTMTKNLLGATGSAEVTDGPYSLAFAWGETASGHVSVNPAYELMSGYFGGRFGNWQSLQIVATRIGRPATTVYYQDSLRVGVPLDAPVEIVFSDQLQSASIPSGVSVTLATDHLGRDVAAPALFTSTYDPQTYTLTITPDTVWEGNTVYDVALTPALHSIGDFPLEAEAHVAFLTVLDPKQDNVVRHPLGNPAAGGSGVAAAVGPLSLRIPADALADYSTVLLTRNPATTPLRADPRIIEEANRRSVQAGGPYRAPLSIQEINVFTLQGDLVTSLAKPAELSIDYQTGTPAAGLIRPQTMALWVLDEPHALWIKIPASQNRDGRRMITAPISRFSVFALMGSPYGSASEVSVFPVPWRPNGPNAGTGAGQTGSVAEGITFKTLPSECTIKIYTLSGDLVRTLRHSDIVGPTAQERWDGKTSGGDAAASGVYLWRVETSEDAKTGKLMIIR